MTKSTGKQKKHTKLNDKKKAIAVDLVEKGNTVEKVARAFNVSRGYIYKVRKEIEANPELFEWYQNKRSDIQLLTQVRNSKIQDLIRDSITIKEIKDASLSEKAKLLGVLGADRRGEYIQERLERDKTTENVGMIVKYLKSVKREISQEDNAEN